MTRIIIEFEVSRDQIQSVYNFSVHKGLQFSSIPNFTSSHMERVVLIFRASEVSSIKSKYPPPPPEYAAPLWVLSRTVHVLSNVS